MLADIEKLVKYEALIKELNELKRQLKEPGSFDKVEITLSPQVVITENWTNESGKVTKTYQFQLSHITDFTERIRKKCDYRKTKLVKNVAKNEKK
jgi:hypothetical protein